MTEPLYTLDILRLASESGLSPRLTDPDATAERRSLVCGSRIAVDVVVDGDGRVTEYGHDVRACALGQASATVLARAIKGKTVAELMAVRDGLAAYLSGAIEEAPAWSGIDILSRAIPYPARHAAIRLPFEAVVEAVAHVSEKVR
ncbi:MAG: iron-sulfur cluster assembly scaffold protein [Pseudomonadota bacterium]